MTPDEQLPPSPDEPERKAEQDESELLRLLVASVQDHSIYVIGADGRIATWSAGARRMKGYTADEIIGQPYERFFTAEDRLAGSRSGCCARLSGSGSSTTKAGACARTARASGPPRR